GGKPIFGYRAGGAQVGSHIRKASPEAAWGFVISTLRNDPRKVLIEQTSMRETTDRVADIYKLDVYTGLETRVARSPLVGADFLTDENGELRIASGLDESTTPRYFLLEDNGWRELRQIHGFSSRSVPVGFLARERALYVSESVSDGFAVYLVSIDTGERKLVSKNQTVPPTSTVEDGPTGRVVAVEYDPD